MKNLQFVLVLAIAINAWECGDAKLGERGEMSPRRRRCYDGSVPQRLKKRERKVLLDGSSSGEVCHRLYPRVSCCPTRKTAYQILHRRDARVGSRPSVRSDCLRLGLKDLFIFFNLTSETHREMHLLPARIVILQAEFGQGRGGEGGGNCSEP